jgi:hypothetical protein
MIEQFRDYLVAFLVLALLAIGLRLAVKSQTRIWRLIGWFGLVLSLTLILVEAYGWYRRGDWRVQSANKFWNDVSRESLLWLDNNLPTAIWAPVEAVLELPAWLVLAAIGLILLFIDHRQLQRRLPGAKPPTWHQRLKGWLQKPPPKEADKT